MTRAIAGAFLGLACLSGTLGVAAACGGSSTDPDEGAGAGLPGRARAPVVAFVDVDVVTMEPGQGVLPDRTVVVRDGVIESVAPTGSATVPEDALVVDGEGRWLMPGLADMHVHLSSSEVEEYLRHGVTTVRNMWGFTALPDIVARVESGELAGPRIRTLSPGIDGPPVRWPQTQLLTDPAEADSVVQAMQDLGYTTLKVYTDLRLDVYDSIVAAAGRRGIAFAGHVPFAVPVDHALRSGQRSVEHLLGYRSRPRSEWEELADLTVEAGAWNCPTLAILLRAGPDPEGLRRDLVEVLHARGAPLLVGTDSGIGITQPGWSVHEELRLMVEAGLTPREALEGATVEAARYFGEEDAWGRVAPGLRADLLLLDADPLENEGATAAHVGVLRGDLWLPLTPH